MEKMIRDGKVAVLISGGFGAGWSTWAGENLEGMAMDARLVQACMDNVSEEVLLETLEEVFGEDFDPYLGGWKDVCVDWVPQGARFVIREYDGSESILLISDKTTMLA